MVAVDDAGNLINPLIVEGQIHGGLAQGIGQAMIEEAVYNEDGQLMTGSFMDYAMPRATDFPRFELTRTVTPTPCNPLGAKGVGEAGTLGSTPCIVSAAVDALSGFGVKHIDMMLRPEKLWRHHPGRTLMIPVAFEYERATSIDDAIAKLAASGGGKLIAGGHSLVPLMKLRLSEPGRLVDIARIPGLSGIKEAAAASRSAPRPCISEIATSKLLRDKCPMIAEAAAEIGDPQVRNRGTHRRQHRARRSGGGFPGGHARARCRHPPEGHGRRADGEGVGVLPRLLRRRPRRRRDDRRRPVRCRSRAAAYAKLHQRASHYAIVGVAAVLDVKGGVIQSARIGLTGATTHAMRLTERRAGVGGQEGGWRSRRRRAGAANDVADMNADLHASADYRRAMIPVFTRRAVGDARWRSRLVRP